MLTYLYSVVPYTPKKKSDALPSIDATNEIQDPLDFSFCRLNKVEGKTILFEIWVKPGKNYSYIDSALLFRREV